MNIVIINQARMTSTRLPGKVLKKVLNRPLLQYQLERLRRVRLCNEIVVATTINASDNPIVDLCKQLGVEYSRGAEENVLSRYYHAAQDYKADLVVRVTSDCPIIDPEVIDKAIAFFIKNKNKYDYVSNTIYRTYPRGMDTEVFSFDSLKDAYINAKTSTEREHVTLYFHSNPHFFRLGNLGYESDQSHHRWTVDTTEDFELIRKIIITLYPENRNFDLSDCLKLIERNPEWSEINAHIEQKE